MTRGDEPGAREAVRPRHAMDIGRERGSTQPCGQARRDERREARWRASLTAPGWVDAELTVGCCSARVFRRVRAHSRSRVLGG